MGFDLRSHGRRRRVGRACCVSVFASLVGCGSRTEIDGIDRAADASHASDASVCVATNASAHGAAPPDAPAADVAGVTRWFGVSSIAMGAGTSWQRIGYDVDGRVARACDACRARFGAAPVDEGSDGIDNAFGRVVVRAISNQGLDPQAVTDHAYRKGEGTLLLRLDDLAHESNDARVPGAIYLTSAYGGEPSYTVADQWLVANTALADGVDIDRPTIRFPSGYMRNGIWVSGDGGPQTIPVPMLGAIVALRFERVVISVRVVDGTNGILAGVVHADDLPSALAPALDALGLCAGDARRAAVEGAARGAADLGGDATCDLVSIGLAFTLNVVTQPTSTTRPAAAPVCR